MAKYFVIVRAIDTREVKMWNDMRTNDLPLLSCNVEYAKWVEWRVEGDEILPLLLQPWVKSVRMIPE